MELIHLLAVDLVVHDSKAELLAPEPAIQSTREGFDLAENRQDSTRTVENPEPALVVRVRRRHELDGPRRLNRESRTHLIVRCIGGLPRHGLDVLDVGLPRIGRVDVTRRTARAEVEDRQT